MSSELNLKQKKKKVNQECFKPIPINFKNYLTCEGFKDISPKHSKKNLMLGRNMFLNNLWRKQSNHANTNIKALGDTLYSLSTLFCTVGPVVWNVILV